MTVTHNPPSKHLAEKSFPRLDPTAFVHETAFVCGDVRLGKDVFVAPFASLRADEGSPFFVGDGSNVQDGVVLHALETFDEGGNRIDGHLVEVEGEKFAIHIGKRVSLAHQSQIHGPSLIEDDTFVGMQAFVFKSRIGKGCVIEPGAKVIGVKVAAKRYVPAGLVVTSQETADNLPEIKADYKFADLNKEVVKVNCELVRAYNKK